MPSKQQDEAKSKISPVLFMTVSGEPMSFFLRPGPVKRKLQPLITAGGGMLCNVQKPGAILLIDPEERASVSETTAHWYISTQYVHDCIEKDEQLTLEDYRLNPEVEKAYSTRLRNSRTAYTAKEDAAILNYVRKHKTEAGGNKLWQEMEKQRVTSHSWQSMKYRYRVRLAHKLSESEEKQTKVIMWKVFYLLLFTLVIPEPEAVEPTISPETGDVPEDHPPSQPDSLLETPSQNVLSKKQKASPKEAQGEPPTRVTRRQLKLEGPQPYNKKLRSSSTPNKSSPEPSKKTKLSIRSAHQKDITADQPPVKRARGKGGAKVLANEQEESEENGTSKTEQPGLFTSLQKIYVKYDLASVTKALLKTSGDWSAALDLLLDPSSFSGPFWTYSDDSLLDSADPDDRHMLQEKYGEEGVAKRLVFLAVEGSS
uniref:Telomeric repeat-binding factor 2-interacting protein 1 n=1 Tax=Sphaeramia orbicularis TaxID=375764 RepID=A0A673A3I4_9TELE